jgi:hypothetical protein
VQFINDIESRGSKLGATVSVSSVSAGDSSAHASLSLALSVSGSFDAVMRTMGAIEFAPYDIRVENLSLNQADKTWQADATVLVGSAPSGS